MRNPRRQLWRPLLLCLLLPLFIWFGGPVSATTTTPPGVSGDPIPDVIVLAPALDQEQRERLQDRLDAIDGVARVTTTAVDGDGPATAFQLALIDTGAALRGPEVIIGEARTVLADEDVGPIQVGGGSRVDAALSETYDGVFVALAALAVVVGVALGLVFGFRRGIAAAVAIGLSVLAAGVLGRRVAGSFDGTIAGTAVPGAVAGLIVAVVLAIRLLLWFRSPRGADGADRIRLAVIDLADELGLTLVGLAIAAALVGLMDPGPSPLTSITVGALAASAVTGAALAPALSFIGDRPDRRPGWLPLSVPDGRDLPLLFLVGVGALLVVLALFGWSRPPVGLADVDDLAAGSEPAQVSERLRLNGGDATSALVAEAPVGSRQVDLLEWARTAADLPAVAWVDVGPTRLTSVGEQDVASSDLLAPADTEGVAVVVLAMPSRGPAGQDALDALIDLPLIGGPPTFSGPAVDAAGAVGSRSTLVVAVLVLAVTGAVGVRIIGQSRSNMVVALGLRLLGGAAVLGLFGLLATGTTAAVLVTGLGLVALTVGLFELEFVSEVSGDATMARQRVGLVGFAILGLAGAVLAVSSATGSGPGVGALGVGLVGGALLEGVVGGLLLRPALLGQRAAFHTAVRPVRVVLHSGLERDAPDGAVEDPEWRRVIDDLLQAEFRFQADPSQAVLSKVFVPDTPLYRQAAGHHASLGEAGLRIVGRSPRLRSIRTVNGRRPTTLAITVDHPVRHLVDADGTVRGVRKAERRSGVLWLGEGDDGTYRIAESVELGTVSLPDDHLGGIDDKPTPLGVRADVETLTQESMGT